jgi:hypothetical protein
MYPGATALTVTPCAAYSCAITRLSWLMAPLLAAYGPWRLWPLRPATEENITIRPHPCSRMPSAASVAV